MDPHFSDLYDELSYRICDLYQYPIKYSTKNQRYSTNIFKKKLIPEEFRDSTK